MNTSEIKPVPGIEMPPENSPPGLPWQRLAEIHEMTRHQPRPKIWETLNKTPAPAKPTSAAADEK